MSKRELSLARLTSMMLLVVFIFTALICVWAFYDSRIRPFPVYEVYCDGVKYESYRPPIERQGRRIVIVFDEEGKTKTLVYHREMYIRSLQ